MTTSEKTVFYAGILNVIPSSLDLGSYLTYSGTPAVASGCIVVRDPLLKVRSPSKGVPVKITTNTTSSYIDIPVNLYQTYQGNQWLGSVYLKASTNTNITIILYITDYNGTILKTDTNTLSVTKDWQKKDFNITNTIADPPPPSITNSGNPNQVRIKIQGPSVANVQIWLDDLRLNKSETVISIFKSSGTLDGDQTLRDPYSNYDNVYFDSRFDYLNIPGAISYSRQTIPLVYRPNKRVKMRKKPGRTKKKRWVDLPMSGSKKTTILEHNLGKVPVVIAYEPNGAYFGGTTIYDTAGIGSFRTLWISADASKLYLNERWYTYKYPLSPTNLTLDCYLFNEPANVANASITPETFNSGEPLVLSTCHGDIFTSNNGQTDTWKARREGQTVEEQVFSITITYYVNIIHALFYLNGIYYAYQLDEDTYLTKDGVDYDTLSWQGWSSGPDPEQPARGWEDLDPLTNIPINHAVMIPGSSTNAIGISLSHNYPKRVEIFYSPTDPNEDADPNNDDPDYEPPSIGFGWTKPLPYKVYISINKGKEWLYKGTLSSPTGYGYGSGGASVACSPSGVAVAVGTMIGGEQIEKVNIIGNWQRFDNENFTPKTVTVTFSAPELAGGVTATGEPIIDKFQRLVGISMTNRGSGYVYTPTVTITDTDQTPVTGTVTVTAANTRTVAATYDSDGNLVTPEQKFWKVGSATASGTSWLHKRTTTITFSNGATANLTFVNGSVTAIIITNQGSEVGPSASAPTITATISDTDNGTEITDSAVPVLTSGRNKKPTIAYSTDSGMTWHDASYPSINYGGLSSVVYATAGGFIAVGYNNLILKSTDGQTWTNISPSAFTKSVHWQTIIYAKSSYIACGFDNASSYIIRSTDGGSSWTQVFTIAGTFIRSLAEYTYGGKVLAAGGEADTSNPYFSGPNVVYSGETCYLTVVGARPGEVLSITGSNNASGQTYSPTVGSNGEASLGNIASTFSLGTDNATTTYTYTLTTNVDFVPKTITHTVRFVDPVNNSIYTAPSSNSSDYTSTSGYYIENTNKTHSFQSLPKEFKGKTFITSDGSSWSNISNGATKDIHHIISSTSYVPS